MYLKSVSFLLFLSAWGWHSHRNKTTVFRVALGSTSERVHYTNTTDPAVSFVLMACFQIGFISRGFVFTWDWSWPTWTKYAIQHCLQILACSFVKLIFLEHGRVQEQAGTWISLSPPKKMAPEYTFLVPQNEAPFNLKYFEIKIEFYVMWFKL